MSRRERRHDRLLACRHRRTRTRGANPVLVAAARALLAPALKLLFRVELTGAQHIPVSGPVLITPNHRSFLDPFVIALGTRRPVYFMAKQEFFHKRLQGWLMNQLGAFPVRRGLSDADAIATARAVLERGDVLVIFPEGTRVRPGPLRAPKRGAARLALTAGATVVPAAVHGTEHARRGWKIRPVKVCVAFAPAIDVPRSPAAGPEHAQQLTATLWRPVQRRYAQLHGTQRVRAVRRYSSSSSGSSLPATDTASTSSSRNRSPIRTTPFSETRSR